MSDSVSSAAYRVSQIDVNLSKTICKIYFPDQSVEAADNVPATANSTDERIEQRKKHSDSGHSSAGSVASAGSSAPTNSGQSARNQRINGKSMLLFNPIG